MTAISIAVVGAGVAGLSFAALASKLPNTKLTLFQKQSICGGRIFSPQVTFQTYADLGANLIDFQTEEQEHLVRLFLENTVTKYNKEYHLHALKQPFLIYENALRNGDYIKNRYFYQGGFSKLIQDISSSIPKDSIITNCQIQKIQLIDRKWQVYGKHLDQKSKNFDFLVLAMDGPASLNLLQSSKLEFTVALTTLLQKITYTTQISAAFHLIGGPPFSCILFKNHPLTFMCSHQEKYPMANKKIVTVQMNEQFSNSNFKKDHKDIQENIRNSLPAEMKNWIGECVAVKHWEPSLIKTKQKLNILDFQKPKESLLMVGDICQGSSRVAGAIESSLKVFKLLNNLLMGLQHL